MKCEENGRCPLVPDIPFYGKALGKCGSRLGGCRMNSTSFPRLRAELEGEWKCETCTNYYVNSKENTVGCFIRKIRFNATRGIPCKGWQPHKRILESSSD